MVKPSRTSRPLTHGQVWGALDRLAERAGMSASGSPAAPGSTQPPSTSPSASPPTAASAGLPPSRSPRRWPPPMPRSTVSCSCSATPPRARRNRCRCSASPRPARAAISTRTAFRPARAGTKWRCPRPLTHMLMRWRYRAISMRPAYRDGDVVVVSPGTRDPPRRPRGGEDHQRRGDGEGIEAPHRENPRSCSHSTHHIRTARWRPRTSRGSRGSCGEPG